MSDFGARRLGNAPFACAICGDLKNTDWWSRGGMAPICSYCETKDTPTPKPFGSFMDRRMARRLCAVLLALETEALHQKNRGKHHG